MLKPASPPTRSSLTSQRLSTEANCLGQRGCLSVRNELTAHMPTLFSSHTFTALNWALYKVSVPAAHHPSVLSPLMPLSPWTQEEAKREAQAASFITKEDMNTNLEVNSSHFTLPLSKTGI